jgi:Leucine-rich repeat (LRR) protein
VPERYFRTLGDWYTGHKNYCHTRIDASTVFKTEKTTLLHIYRGMSLNTTGHPPCSCGFSANFRAKPGSTVLADGDVKIDENTFPDPTFRAWILKQGWDADGVLSVERLARVKEINVWDYRIKDLSGIEHFTALRHLYVGTTQIKELPDLSSLSELERLDVHGNQIEEIPGLSYLGKLAIVNYPAHEGRGLDVDVEPARVTNDLRAASHPSVAG